MVFISTNIDLENADVTNAGSLTGNVGSYTRPAGPQWSQGTLQEGRIAEKIIGQFEIADGGVARTELNTAVAGAGLAGGGGNALSINDGAGLGFSGDNLQVQTGAGAVIDGDQVAVDLGGGQVDAGSISLSTLAGDGLKAGGGNLNIEPADFAGPGLTDDGADNLEINDGAGLGFSGDNLQVQTGAGAVIDGDQVAVDLGGDQIGQGSIADAAVGHGELRHDLDYIQFQNTEFSDLTASGRVAFDESEGLAMYHNLNTNPNNLSGTYILLSGANVQDGDGVRVTGLNRRAAVPSSGIQFDVTGGDIAGAGLVGQVGRLDVDLGGNQIGAGSLKRAVTREAWHGHYFEAEPGGGTNWCHPKDGNGPLSEQEAAEINLKASGAMLNFRAWYKADSNNPVGATVGMTKNGNEIFQLQFDASDTAVVKEDNTETSISKGDDLACFVRIGTSGGQLAGQQRVRVKWDVSHAA